jgi:hypothetical protein
VTTNFHREGIMNYIYSALFGCIVGAVIAVVSYKYGLKNGGEKALKGILETFNEKFDRELKEKEREKREQIAYVQDIIATFLMKEMKKNYEALDISGKKNLPVGTEFDLEFVAFEKTKYILLENPTRTVREIYKLYSLFEDITKLNDTNQVQDKMNKLDEIIQQKDIVDILLSDVKYMRVR